MIVYDVRMRLPDKEQTEIEKPVMAKDVEQAIQLTKGIYGDRVSILSIKEAYDTGL